MKVIWVEAEPPPGSLALTVHLFCAAVAEAEAGVAAAVGAGAAAGGGGGAARGEADRGARHGVAAVAELAVTVTVVPVWTKLEGETDVTVRLLPAGGGDGGVKVIWVEAEPPPGSLALTVTVLRCCR